MLVAVLFYNRVSHYLNSHYIMLLSWPYYITLDWSNYVNRINWLQSCWVNTLRLRRNGHHFPDDIFKYISLNGNVWIPIKISQFVPEAPITNIPTLVQIMAWHWPGNKPLSEPMMVSLLMYICVTRHQSAQWRQLYYYVCLIGDSPIL